MEQAISRLKETSPGCTPVERSCGREDDERQVCKNKRPHKGADEPAFGEKSRYEDTEQPLLDERVDAKMLKGGC
jgi:hypothetical protein